MDKIQGELSGISWALVLARNGKAPHVWWLLLLKAEWNAVVSSWFTPYENLTNWALPGAVICNHMTGLSQWQVSTYPLWRLTTKQVPAADLCECLRIYVLDMCVFRAWLQIEAIKLILLHQAIMKRLSWCNDGLWSCSVHFLQSVQGLNTSNMQ